MDSYYPNQYRHIPCRAYINGVIVHFLDKFTCERCRKEIVIEIKPGWSDNLIIYKSRKGRTIPYCGEKCRDLHRDHKQCK